MPALRRTLSVTTRNATFQRWESLLGNRRARHRAGELLVQGVRPIDQALAHGWPVHALLRPLGGRPSAWAARVWADAGGERFEVAPGLLAELAQREDERTELVAVVGMPADDLGRVLGAGDAGAARAGARAGVPLVTVFDRPGQPGNIGTLQRSIDAFGGTGLVVTGHAADPYDPRAVRASTGSCFAVPTVRVDSAQTVLDWVQAQRRGGMPMQVWGTDEDGETDLSAVPWELPTVLVLGNETRGMAKAWREACDGVLSIPMVGSASSLNAAVAGSIVLHAALRGRVR
ncbi:rRNA methyltransferase [Serinicoccus chungangensis]|uniref:rRNA methyltransferase n=1 Tax=Serinicoccus chungangensis TaxID=767452 RepID=A0A0W8I563_9MICO|nr:TrmH family RNA methyltransferase [Serinicoccus chungangensis]KUG53375.1 rRNA methyltransferase [Serinicoccus chungangensis]